MPSQKQFDIEEVLDRAMEAFWESGYEGTSMTRLLDRMGIQKGSFYATFSSKHEVFLQAVDRYVRVRFSEFEDAMAGLAPRQAIERMFDSVQEECRYKSGSRGCFVVNAALELAPRDDAVGEVVRRTLKMHQEWIAELLVAGQEDGTITSTGDAASVAKALLGLIIAMRVYARAGMPASYAVALRSQAGGLLD